MLLDEWRGLRYADHPVLARSFVLDGEQSTITATARKRSNRRVVDLRLLTLVVEVVGLGVGMYGMRKQRIKTAWPLLGPQPSEVGDVPACGECTASIT